MLFCEDKFELKGMHSYGVWGLGSCTVDKQQLGLTD
jgi:hypothetical protein